MTPGTISQWLRHAREGGFEALRRRSAKVPPPKLTAEQLAQLPNLALTGNRSLQLSRPGLDDQARDGVIRLILM